MSSESVFYQHFNSCQIVLEVSFNVLLIASIFVHYSVAGGSYSVCAVSINMLITQAKCLLYIIILLISI